MKSLRLAVVGDYRPTTTAHEAIQRSLAQAAGGRTPPLVWNWLGTDALVDAPRQLADYAGIWCAPGSPYRSMDGALAAIRFARETGRPFLGTCGGFQHALIEIARDVLGLADADHAETNPAGATLVVTALACSLVGQRGAITYTPGSRLAAIIGPRSDEGYHCSYGPDPRFRTRLESAGLAFTGFAADGALRAGELAGHPFFAGTLFQPERAALTGPLHPLVAAFVAAAASQPLVV